MMDMMDMMESASHLTGRREQEVGGVDAGLDEVVCQAAAQTLNSAVCHDHLDLLAGLPSVNEDLLHKFRVGVGQDDVTIPDLLVCSLRDGLGM